MIPALLGGALPSSIKFSSSQSLNPYVFSENVFPAIGNTWRRSTNELSCYHTAANCTFQNSGAIIDNTVDGFPVREHIGILLHFYGGLGTHPHLEYDKARLVTWDGKDLLPPNLRLNLKTGTLEVRSPYYQPGAWFDTRIPYVWVASSLGLTHLIFTKYNEFEMLWPENSGLLYKLDFSSANIFYNRNMIFCGNGTNACNSTQALQSNLNERLLRMNPKLGVGIPQNQYIIGTNEPVIIPTNPTHNLHFIKGFYFSYSTDYINWNAATWNQGYFMSIASPRVTSMIDDVYQPNLANATLNPFYSVYQFRFQLREKGQLNEGTYVGPGVAADDTDDGSSEDDNDDTDPNTTYNADIVDVYIDSDADGIPDAWDKHPSYFDANVNGILDGNEIVDFSTQTICINNNMTPPCNVYQDEYINPTIIQLIGASGPANPYLVSFPKTILGSPAPFDAVTKMPQISPAQFVVTDNPAIYYLYPSPPPAVKRKYPTWWDTASTVARRTQKVRFINGTVVGNDILLNPSPELDFLQTNNVFSASSYLTRVPPTLWP
jgi:hypothetical protein